MFVSMSACSTRNLFSALKQSGLRASWFGRQFAFSKRRGAVVMRTITIAVLSSLLLLVPGFAEDGSPAVGSIRGDVFTKGTNGEPAVLPGAHIVLHGPVTKETES